MAADAPAGHALLPVSGLVEQFPGPALAVDVSGAVVEQNALGAQLLSISAEDSINAVIQAAAACLQSGVPNQQRLVIPVDEGKLVFDLAILPSTAAETGAGLALVFGRDGTLDHNLISALTASRQLFKDLVNCSADFSWETGPEGRFGFVSPRGALGFTADELNKQVAGVVFSAGEEGREVFQSMRPLSGHELWVRRKDGTAACLEVSLVPVFEGDVFMGCRGVCRDVTDERRRAEALAEAHAELHHRSQIDDLTGLVNRRTFEERVARRLAHGKRQGRSGTLLYLDLDGFKPINDLHGHHVGDLVLQRFGAKLTGSLRAGDIAARLGGDEFALWLEETAIDGGKAKASMLVQQCQALASEAGVQDTNVGVSIGIAESNPLSDERFDDLLGRADAAMYDAKRNGKNAYAVAGGAALAKTDQSRALC